MTLLEKLMKEVETANERFNGVAIEYKDEDGEDTFCSFDAEGGFYLYDNNLNLEDTKKLYRFLHRLLNENYEVGTVKFRTKRKKSK